MVGQIRCQISQFFHEAKYTVDTTSNQYITSMCEMSKLTILSTQKKQACVKCQNLLYSPPKLPLEKNEQCLVINKHSTQTKE